LEPGAGDARGGWDALTFSAFGVPIRIAVNDAALLERLPAYLPPQWRPAPPERARFHYALARHGDGACSVRSGPADRHRFPSEERALEAVASALHMTVSRHATEGLFVHAGVVGWHGQAIVIPGRSFTGKTTLTKALVEAGAVYYSDEFAVFDEAGLVHPYARPLSIRHGGTVRGTRTPVEALGGEAGRRSLPVGLVLVTRHEPGAAWSPVPLSAGQAVLRLLDNTVRAQEVPEAAIAVLGRAVDGARVLEGPRGEAAALAPRLLAAVTDGAGGGPDRG
ncbi:MAG: hypothetical protein R3362_10810, partial [Rhodothermales bacterium]|nr:hypothetical protein [Rhodothermales bacterium]